MKRYYLCDVIGTGAELDPYRAAVADIPAVKNWGMQDGTLNGKLVALCIVACADHAPFKGRPSIDPMPDFPLDGKISAMQTAVKNKMVSDAERRGFDASTIGSSDGYRDAINAFGRQLNPTFDIDSMDVTEPN